MYFNYGLITIKIKNLSPRSAIIVLTGIDGQKPRGEKPTDNNTNLPPADFPKDHLAQRNETVLKKLLHAKDSEVHDKHTICFNIFFVDLLKIQF